MKDGTIALVIAALKPIDAAQIAADDIMSNPMTIAAK
jgi:hypothetical protein